MADFAVRFNVPDYTSIGTNSVTFSFYIDGSPEMPSGGDRIDSKTGDKIRTVYRNLSWKYTAYSSSGSCTINNRTVTVKDVSSDSVSITVSAFASCSRYRYYYKAETDEEGNPTGDYESSYYDYDGPTEISLDEDGETITFYMWPGEFTGYNNITQGTIIQSEAGLTVAKVNSWISHCNRYLTWRKQEPTTMTQNCSVTSGGLITADWYNKCLEAALHIGDRVTGGANGDIITANRIKTLADAISTHR